MFTLYYTAHTCSLATHIVLEELGVPYDLKRVDFGSQQQKSAEYLSINPKARVPALVTKDGILTETPALLIYLAQSYPTSGLAPLDDPFELAELQAFNSFICSTLHVAHSHRMRGSRWADDPAAIVAMQKKVPDSVGSAWQIVEDRLFRGPWVMGEHYSVADPYMFTMAEWIESDGLEASRFPKVAEHRARMKERPSVQRAWALEGRK